MVGCDIIYSQKINRFYVGVIQNDLNTRIQKHNEHSYGNHRFTAKANDWKLFLFMECDFFKQAARIEKHIKNMKSSVYIQNMKKYPEMIEKLKEKYQSI